MNLKWYDNQENLWYIMKTLVNFVFEFSNIGIYHSDLKSANVVVILNS